MPANESKPRADAPIGAGLLLVLAFLRQPPGRSPRTYICPLSRALPRTSDVSASGVQLTLTAFLIGMAAGQLGFGPLSDRYGRTRPLLLGTGAFVLASIACAAWHRTWEVLVAARFVQGLCASAGAVIARAVVADLTSGRAAARTFSLLMTIGGVAPVVAPVSWRRARRVLGLARCAVGAGRTCGC